MSWKDTWIFSQKTVRV